MLKEEGNKRSYNNGQQRQKECEEAQAVEGQEASRKEEIGESKRGCASLAQLLGENGVTGLRLPFLKGD